MHDTLKLPNGWSSDALLNLADYHNGAAFNSKHWAKDGLPIIRIEQINNPDAETDKYHGPVLPTNYINTGDLIFSWSATLKVVVWNSGPAVLNQHLYKVVPKAFILRDLLLHILDFNMARLSGQSQGSTMKHVTRKELSRFRVIYPIDVCVQQKIARILQTIDQAIEKTEALIEKYQQIKAGLMHDLFTRGIGADGQLRPPREQAPELYQQTPIGWIPKGWDVVGLHYEITISHGFAFSGSGFFDEPPGEVLLTPGNFHRDGGLYFTLDNTKYFRGNIPSETILSPGEVVTVMTDLSPQTLILGRFAIVNTDFPVLHNQRIGLVKCKKPESWDRLYLVAALNNERVRKEIIVGATGTTVRHTSPGRILDLSIARPSVDEQKSCAELLGSIQNNLTQEVLFLKKLGQQKSGLMHDLLTGKVQVNADQPEAVHV